MAKTKFFRVAVEGTTVDGRTIDRDMIQQMADTYNPATYTARINCEHLRGFSPQPPFNSYGSVDAVKAEEIELELAGKKEKRLALMASFDVNDQAKEINKAGQKLFSSVEIAPDFAGSKKAYLFGVALTDTPASLGTELLKFSRDEKRKDNILLFTDAFEIEFEDDTSGAAEQVTGLFSSMRKAFDVFAAGGKVAEPEKPAVQTPAEPKTETNADLAAFAKLMGEGMDGLAQAFKASSDATAAAIGQFRTEIDTIKKEIEKAPSRNYTARPLSNGGDGRVRADC